MVRDEIASNLRTCPTCARATSNLHDGVTAITGSRFCSPCPSSSGSMILETGLDTDALRA